MEPEYIHLLPDGFLPEMTNSAFRAVVIVETEVTAEWRKKVSAWLVRSGCLYMMAWGRDCSLWNDSVDYANLEEFGYGDIPDNRLVMTTWHDKETLKDVFWFCEQTAHHPTVDLNRIILVHVSLVDQKSQMLSGYHDARRAG